MQAIDHRRTPNPSCQLREVSEETIKDPVTNPWLLGSAPGTVAVLFHLASSRALVSATSPFTLLLSVTL